MFKVNEYFDGTVKSIAFGTAEGPATIGVMAPGEYEFGTAQREIMHVVSGALTVKLPDAAPTAIRRARCRRAPCLASDTRRGAGDDRQRTDGLGRGLRQGVGHGGSPVE